MLYFRYRNTACYLIPSADGQGLLAFDAGWPSSLHEYARAMKATGFRFAQIKWAMVSHFHMDHAGLIRDFQDAGIECLLFENQGGGIDEMERIIGAGYKDYRPIRREAFTRIATSESRGFLRERGIEAEVIQTPGHSEDSLSLVTDEGDALIGDLYPISQIMPDDQKSRESWARIEELGGRRIWPSHAAAFELLRE